MEKQRIQKKKKKKKACTNYFTHTHTQKKKKKKKRAIWARLQACGRVDMETGERQGAGG